MQKKGERLTKVQRDLLKGITRLAKEQGLELKTIEVPWHEPTHTEVSNFLKRLDQAEKALRNSKIVFVRYQNSINYTQQNKSYVA